MKNLYRRYRPVCLEDVVGQPQVTTPLTKSLEQKKISHAYLFIGPRGTGKTSVARIFAHEINGFKYEIEDDYVDIVEIDGASNRGIDNIRELREKAAIAPTSGKYKVYIIDEVHMLTKEAFNALLKTLEEPPSHVIFIMATTDAYKVPVTITSRAQTYTFKLADHDTMFSFLREISKKEKIQITDDALNIIVRRGGGSFRDTLSLLDQISTLSNEKITKELVDSALGLPEDETITKILENYNSFNLHEISALLKDLLSSGIRSETIAEEMISQIITKPSPELMPLLAKLPEIKAPFAEAKLLVALTNEPINVPKPQPVKQPSEKPTLDKPAEQVAPAKKVSFDWQNFMQKVKNLNDVLHLQLTKVDYEFIDGVLHIYPKKKIIQTILSRDNNKKVLVDASEGIKIEIHNINEKPTTKSTKDEILTKISDIMGGEVQNDGGENPFEK